MILSTSSSRAVSMRTGRSPFWRMRLQTSTPSMSGSIRSSTTSAGFSESTRRRASWPLAVVRTPYPAFFRYAATKEAIDDSSSTTSTVWGLAAIPRVLPVRRDHEAVGLHAGQRLEVVAVQRVAAVRLRRVGAPGDLDPAFAERDEVHVGAVDRDPE